MSAQGETDGVMSCASCGRAEVDDIKLKMCDGGCDLVKYCRDECQENHREQHDEECRKRLAELRDRDLFNQPDESHLGECPICCLPLSINPSNSTLMPCCCKLICNGCDFSNAMREIEAGLQQRCAFCREPVPEVKEEHDKKMMERIQKNDPAAMCHMAKKRYDEGDYETALEYWTKAAGLGNADAQYSLSIMYRDGEGVQNDEKKQVYHLEDAAIAGHPNARHNLGCFERRNGRFERARKHWIIAANLGHDGSLKCIEDLYARGHASKEDYADALRAYQAAAEATKSAERKAAEAYYAQNRG